MRCWGKPLIWLNPAALLSGFYFSRCEGGVLVTRSIQFSSAILPLQSSLGPAKVQVASHPLLTGGLGQLSGHLPYPAQHFFQLHRLWGGSRQHIASEVPQSSRRVSALFLFPLQTTECTLGQPVGRCQTLPVLYSLLQEQGQPPVITCTWLVLPCFTGCILRLSSTFQPPFPFQHLR